MYTNNNTNNSRKENYNHSNFLFYNNNYNKKEIGADTALCGGSAALPCKKKVFLPFQQKNPGSPVANLPKICYDFWEQSQY